MDKNVGVKDGHIRIALGAVIILIALFLVEQPVVRILLALISAALAGTAYVHHCPIYRCMGKNTCEGDAPVVPQEQKEEATPVEEAPEEPAEPAAQSEEGAERSA